MIKYFAERLKEYDYHFVELLIDLGIDLNHRLQSGATALYYASRFSVSFEIIRLLVERGVNIN